MKLARRKFLHLAASGAAVPAISRVAKAQTYPARPITMIVPIGAGSVSDVVGRVVADRMAKSLGQPRLGKAERHRIAFAGRGGAPRPCLPRHEFGTQVRDSGLNNREAIGYQVIAVPRVASRATVRPQNLRFAGLPSIVFLECCATALDRSLSPCIALFSDRRSRHSQTLRHMAEWLEYPAAKLEVDSPSAPTGRLE